MPSPKQFSGDRWFIAFDEPFLVQGVRHYYLETPSGNRLMLLQRLPEASATEHDANARLIEAAPDFFAAAEEALRYISDDEMRVSADTPFMVMLAAAYKKALDARPL